jgi:hypothetical protein
VDSAEQQQQQQQQQLVPQRLSGVAVIQQEVRCSEGVRPVVALCCD